MIQYQILQANIMRIIWQTVKSITNEILGVKEPEWLWKNPFTFMLLFSLWTCCWFTYTNMFFFLLLLLSKYKQVFCSCLKAWMSVITAFWKIRLKYTWTWYGNCLSALCNQKICYVSLSIRKISLTVWILIKVNLRYLWVFILADQFFIFFLLYASMLMTKTLNKFEI